MQNHKRGIWRDSRAELDKFTRSHFVVVREPTIDSFNKFVFGHVFSEQLWRAVVASGGLWPTAELSQVI